MKKHLQARLAQINNSRFAKGAMVVAGSVVGGSQAFAVTTLTVLPAAAATATDNLITAAADVGIILFGIGVPFTLAYLGWRVFHKSSNQATK